MGSFWRQNIERPFHGVETDLNYASSFFLVFPFQENGAFVVVGMRDFPETSVHYETILSTV